MAGAILFSEFYVELELVAAKLGYRLCAVGIEGAGEFLSDGGGGGVLDRRALEEIDKLAIAKDGDGGGGWRVALEVAAGAVSGLAILAGEDGDGLVGLGVVLEGKADAGAHLAGCATADGVHDEHGGSGGGKCSVYVGTGAGLEDTGFGQLFAHRNEHQLWVHRVASCNG